MTGGIASGKSTVARMFEDKGAYLIDFDLLGHLAESPDQPAWKAIVEYFGSDALREDGTIDRGKLGKIVFSDPDKLSVLNSIVHPAVYALWRRMLADVEKRDTRAIVIADIPLLIETKAQHLFDLIILVYVPADVQIERLVERDEFSRAEAEKRLAAQMPIDEKISQADFVINNRGPVEKTRAVVNALWDELLAREERMSRAR